MDTILSRFLILLVWSTALFAQAAPVPGDELLLNYESLKSFKADFTQVFTSKVTKKKGEPEQGIIYYQAPSRMRFDYRIKDKLDRQQFLTDTHFTVINHGKKSVLTKKGMGDVGDYLVFLKGVSEIKKKFSIKKGDVAVSRKAGIAVDEGHEIFKLTPLAKIQNLRYLFLIMNGKEVRSVVVIDEMGNINQLTFSAITYDPKLDPSVFTFTLPAGYEVSNL